MNTANRIAVISDGQGSLSWRGTPASQISGAWGDADAISAPIPRPVDILFRDIDFNGAFEDIHRVVERLAAHAGVASWLTNRTSHYRPLCSCIGVRDFHLSPIAPQLLAPGHDWSLDDLSPEPARPPAEVAEIAHREMDAWVWSRLSGAIDAALANRQWQGIPLADDVVSELTPRWDDWKNSLGTGTNPRHFLTMMLAIAQQPGHTYREGRRRLGPRAIPLLTRGTIVALAVTTLYADLGPLWQVGEGRNLHTSSLEGGHVIALETDNGVALHVNPPNLQYEPPLVLLAGFPDVSGSSALMELARRFDRGSSIRLGAPVPGYPVIIPAHSEFEIALSKGLSAVRSRLNDVSQGLAKTIEDLRRQIEAPR
ncbi:ABC-three component system protein [Vulgatibacter incomptus]|uniref:ABC-three component system protein n=1 Tax=Vulgatibacter incomptus TaxID=1391653 RepID=UPI0026C3322F